MKIIKNCLVVLCILICFSGCSKKESLNSVPENKKTVLETSEIAENPESSDKADKEPIRPEALIKPAEEIIIQSGDMEQLLGKNAPERYLYLGSTNDEKAMFLDLEKMEYITQVDIKTGEKNNIDIKKDTDLEEGHNFLSIIYQDPWLIWSENTDSGVYYVGVNKGPEWAVSALNLDTKEKILIDRENDYYPKERDFDPTPMYIDGKNDTFAFLGYDADESGVYPAIKVFDFTKKKLTTVAKQEKIEGVNRRYGAPSVGEKYVVFSSSILKDWEIQDSILYKYDIESGEVSVIPTDYSLSSPIISGRYIAAEEKVYGEELKIYIHIYDLETETWIEKIDEKAPIHKKRGRKPYMTDMDIYNNYLIWDNLFNELYVYDIEKNIYYVVINENEGKRGGIAATFRSNFILWGETPLSGEHLKKIIKYAILKE